MRDKLTFSCKEDNYKLKLYDQGATLSLENSVKILSLKEATKHELQVSKTAEIKCHPARQQARPQDREQNTARKQARSQEETLPGRQQELWILQWSAPPWEEKLPSRRKSMQQVQ